ncbi:hypothetical protein PG996_000128 [Apiospora saccharicola]|uniref:Uncharacterized protein n=1 Tax=Apiospora saccharicola TaxID=335842 RepID=A0ABR1WCV8_9PEZI
MSGRNLNKTFRHPGFQLGKGNVFADETTADRIYEAMVGPLNSEMSGHAAKKNFAAALDGLFTILHGKKDLFRALRDTELFWHAVAAQWDGLQQDTLSPGDVQLIAHTYMRGRRAVTGSVKKAKTEAKIQDETDLIDAVDAWIEAADEFQALGPQPTFNVTIRQHPVTVAAQQLDDLDLSAGARVWPPKYLNAQERAWVSDSHVEWQLRGNIGSFPFDGRIRKKDVPAIPNSLTYPQDVKLFLCWAALARYDPAESKFAVFMAPIAFMDKRDRKDNYVATGSLSKRMATIGEFFEYALEMINNQGREMNDRCVRHGLGLALRRTPKRDSRVPGFQVILYDPEHGNLAKQPRKPKTANKDHDELVVNLHEWREEVELVAESKLKVGKGRNRKSQFAELWCGGKKPVALQKEYGIAPGDSVSHVAAWLFDAVVGGKFPTPKAPIVELEDHWGYEFIDTLHGDEAVQRKAREDESSGGDDEEEEEEGFELEEEEYESDEMDTDSDSEYNPSEFSDD